MKKQSFRLDRNKFKPQSFEEADNQLDYWLKKSYAERLQAAWYLIAVAFQFDLSHPPHLDRKKFSTRQHPAV